MSAQDVALEYNSVREGDHVISVPDSGAAASPMVCSTYRGTWVYSQPWCLQAESLIIVPFLLPRLLNPRSSLPQQLPLTVMPPGSAASIRAGGHVKGSKEVCHHTQK